MSRRLYAGSPPRGAGAADMAPGRDAIAGVGIVVDGRNASGEGRAYPDMCSDEDLEAAIAAPHGGGPGPGTPRSGAVECDRS